jgi:hypothetical protein
LGHGPERLLRLRTSRSSTLVGGCRVWRPLGHSFEP